MNNAWDVAEATALENDPLALRVYSSRLLGREPSLVLHGGGNTSVKAMVRNVFGEQEQVLYVKGSGWDLATIEKQGFAPVRLDVLQKMAELEQLGDTEMVDAQRAAMTNANAPNPSVEAILHAIIPFTYVDHTHADAIVTISNSAGGEAILRSLYGDEVLILPYIMPGFVLARQVAQLTAGIDWSSVKGIVLLHHGVFTFADAAAESYGNMIELVSRAEDYLSAHARQRSTGEVAQVPDLKALAMVRKAVSEARGAPVLAMLNHGSDAVQFSLRGDVADIATRGPLTPDHVIRTKRTAMMIGEDAEASVNAFVGDYFDYFSRHHTEGLTCLDPAPRWAVWPGRGALAFGVSPAECGIIADICSHTMHAIHQAELLGGWQALPEKDIFELEYWELEQAKLKKGAATMEMRGRIALVTGAASGIGAACVRALLQKGAVVAALDINPAVTTMFSSSSVLGVVCDMTDAVAIRDAVEATVRHFGGLDIVISNAGCFPASHPIEGMPFDTWQQSLALNLSSHQLLLSESVPYLRYGIDAAVVLMASKNVPAPGPGAAAYSVAKAGLTQLARVAALELGGDGIRVNVLHPNAVFDTAIWTDEVLAKRAASYGLSVEAYKTNNILGCEVTSRHVAEMACAMAGPLFACTTGAQLPLDGGNERVI
ncbi:bifunctional aldolase/short-chain dehydrogenase [Mariprofundus erugo]|uniref:bifunctional aldolase/short-chain dehydrogenase n=1 Tax=Mariprofundus erugo TaxID=2528639 RepID=UPI0010FE4290|nr:bifunctional aldolase/short-chain dehydrogenase [Mariprofundus erugo]TLS77315.1 bifunctional aldolase/short-chain dehydrogenase [Mariprofundus erugo]